MEGTATSTSTSRTSITEGGYTHHARSGDKRFAALAAQPYAALADTDRAWLVSEHAAQTAARESQSGGSGSFGILALILVVAGIAAIAAAAFASSFQNPSVF
jgi:hypothetical protein